MLTAYVVYMPHFLSNHIDGLMQDCSISSALAMEILQFCTKPSICAAFPWMEEIKYLAICNHCCISTLTSKFENGVKLVSYWTLNIRIFNGSNQTFKVWNSSNSVVHYYWGTLGIPISEVILNTWNKKDFKQISMKMHLNMYFAKRRHICRSLIACISFKACQMIPRSMASKRNIIEHAMEYQS